MTSHNKYPMDPTELRQKAQEFARERAARKLEDSEALSPEKIQKTLHELQVHQIELEMQNEELRTAQAEIEAERERYLDLYDLAPVGYCTLSEKGIILETNITASTLLGTTRDMLVKQPIARFIHKNDQDIYYLHRMKLFAEGNPQECELRLVKPGGALIWAHLTATVAQAEDSEPVCRVVISDINERKRAEEALKKSEMFLNNTIDSLTAHITVLDDRGGIILTNKAYRDFAAQNGIEPGTVSEGANYLAVCDAASGEHSEEATPFAEGIRDVLSGKRQSFKLEYPCHSSDEERWFIGHVTPFDSEGWRRVVVAHEIITERKRAEESIKTAHKLLQVKNQELEQFIYSVSHDLKSPLVTVKTFAGMLRQDLLNADQPQINEDLNYIDKAADKLGQLLDALLRYSRIGRIDTPEQTVSVDQQVQNCLAALAGILQQHKVQISTGDLPQQLHGDPVHFGQIWQNLIENAVKYRGDQAHPRIEIGATHRGHDVVFYVRDNGMGIAPEHRERIFNLFSQLHSGSDGSGLGLALVEKIVSIYRGRIWVESAGDGTGSCFMFTLPGALVKEYTAI